MKWLYAGAFFIGLLIIIFIIDYYIINKRKLSTSKKGKKKKEKQIGELDYMIIKFKLNPKKIDKKKAIFWISLINSFIISLVSTILMLAPFKIIWQMLIAFVLLFGLIYSLYELYGRHLKKKEEKENDNTRNR